MSAESSQRVTGALKKLIKSTVQVDFFANYRAKVVAQSADKTTLDVKPDSDKLPATMSKIPIRLGLPGTTVKVQAGCYVMIGWDGGNPARPYALLWDLNGTMLELDITATTEVKITAENVKINSTTGNVTLNNGTRTVACIGDIVTGTAGPYPISGGTVATSATGSMNTLAP